MVLGDAAGDVLALELGVGVGEGLMLCEAWKVGLASGEAEGEGVVPICPVLGFVLGTCVGATVWLCCCTDGLLSGVFNMSGGEAMSVHPANVMVVNEL